MSERTIRAIWWRLLVPFAVLVFCATLPSMFAADETRPWERGDGGAVSILAYTPAAEQSIAERNLMIPPAIRPIGPRMQLGMLAWGICSVADIATTASKAGTGSCVEANPVNGSGGIARTAAVTAIASAGLYYLTRGMPDDVAWIPWAVGGIARCAAAAHNARVQC